jgi:sigma-B regulation protein RsbU (phosphoserine phosphatase)
MALIRSLIRVYAEQTFAEAPGSDPVLMKKENQELEVVKLTNNYLVRHHGHECMFATLFFGVLNSASGHLVYINGGHEPLYVIGENGVKKELSPTGPAVGIIENLKINAQQLELVPGDLLLGITDGVTEARNLNKEFFTRTRVKEILAQPVASARELLDGIQKQVSDFAGMAPRSDDITMLAIQRMA